MNSVFSKWSSFFISFHWDVSQKVFDRYRDKYTDKWIYREIDHNVPTHTSLTILYFFLTFLILFPYFFLLYLLYFVHFFPLAMETSKYCSFLFPHFFNVDTVFIISGILHDYFPSTRRYYKMHSLYFTQQQISLQRKSNDSCFNI